MKLKNTKGFSILAIILVLVAVVVAIGVWSLSGATNVTNSATSSSDILASSIINDSLKYKLSYDSLMIQGITYAQVRFDPTGGVANNVNILAPTGGLSWNQFTPKALVNTTYPSGYWVFSRNSFFGKDVGDAYTSEAVLILSGLNTQVCQSINKILYASQTIPTYNDSDPVINNDSDITFPYSTNRVYLITTSLNISGWTSGCLNHNGKPNENYYFKVLQVR